MSIQRSSIHSRRAPRLSRHGVTVIEVLFAMGIALMGLAGIASLLLLGGRQAGESSRAAEGQALAQDWYGEFTARGLNSSAKWAWWQDSSSALQWFDKQLSASVPSKGPGTLYRRELGRESICLDPTFFSGRDLNNTLTASGWYRPSVFPYYHDRYNPTVDPAIAPSSAMQWTDQPRMLRVTWATPASTGSPIALSSRVLEQVFSSQDDLSVVLDEDDNSVAPTRGISFYGSTTGTPLPLGRYAAESQYSWLATLSPTVPLASVATESTNLYTLSLVVMSKRDRMIFDPNASTPRSVGSAATPTNNPQGERLTWVYPLSGNFIGGTGGRVRLISSDGADPMVHVGDWIMLAKYFRFESVSGTPPLRPNSVFRWFRVVSVEDEETYGSLTDVGVGTDPYGLTPPNDVWAQDVVLEGPDWIFGTATGAPSGESTPTTGTLLKGTVGVYERVVNVP